MNKKVEKNIVIKNGLDVQELRQLQELSSFNRALNHTEFMQIIHIYKEAIDRVTEEGRKQGIEI